MDLKDFVAESLKQIIDGVNEAKKYADANGAIVNPLDTYDPNQNIQRLRDRITGAAVETIQFDVAVTAIEGTQTKGGIGVLMGAINLGSQGQSEHQNTSVSRLKFSIPIILPTTR